MVLGLLLFIGVTFTISIIMAITLDKKRKKEIAKVENFCLDRRHKLDLCYRFAIHQCYTEEQAIRLITKHKILREETE